jgi:hypothetical protein
MFTVSTRGATTTSLSKALQWCALGITQVSVMSVTCGCGPYPCADQHQAITTTLCAARVLHCGCRATAPTRRCPTRAHRRCRQSSGEGDRRGRPPAAIATRSICCRATFSFSSWCAQPCRGQCGALAARDTCAWPHARWQRQQQTLVSGECEGRVQVRMQVQATHLPVSCCVHV